MTIAKTLAGAQRGLPLPSSFGQVLTINLKDKNEATRQELLTIIRDIANDIDKHSNDTYQKCGVVAAFCPELWGSWTNRTIPIKREVIGGGNKYKDTGGDVLLYIKAPDKSLAARLVSTIKPRLDKIAKPPIDVVQAGRRKDIRVAGGRYLEGITNPNDPVTLAEDILVSDPEIAGASYGFTQKFKFDWPRIAIQSAGTEDEMVGRNPDGASLPQHATHSHIHRAHIKDGHKNQRKILRQALAYGKSSGYAGREEGVMFVAFCNDQPRFERVLKNLLGTEPKNPVDRLMAVVDTLSGGYWYVPAATELGVPGVKGPGDIVEEAHWDVQSPNGYLFYNSQDYLHKMTDKKSYKDPPSDRLLSLLTKDFSHWRDGWMDRQAFPRLPHLTEWYKDNEAKMKEVQKYPIPIRKAWANYKTLADLLSLENSSIRDVLYRAEHKAKAKSDSKKNGSTSKGKNGNTSNGAIDENAKEDPKRRSRWDGLAPWNGLLRIEPNELIVGQIPDFTLGRGKEVIPYLDKDETKKFWLKASLNEWAAMGHVVPHFDRLVQKGLGKLCEELQTKQKEAESKNDATAKSQAIFYESALISIQGVQGYLKNWALLAEKTGHETTNEDDKKNMQDVAKRLARLVDHPPSDFQDAVQLVFSFHCCLHLVGELTALGRLDQIFWPFLDNDLKSNNITMGRAQEIIDCLWVKLGENAFVNRAFIYDYVTYGTTAVCGVGGNFPQGGGINQWVQQVTVGGYKALDGDPQGGANPVTLLCLKASRRIPVNAPTLSLRVYEKMEDEYLDEAATAILAGGAQPILYNDDKLCEGLYRSGEQAGRGTVGRAWSRNYAADGCYEPMFAGASEFTFNNVAPMMALEQTLNQGATYGAAGPESLRGLKQTFRSPPPAKIKTFKDLQDIFLEQVEWLVIQCYNVMLQNYGNLAEVCPSPLLSVLIDGCVESGRDLTNGGSRFHLMAPLCVGVSNTIDSLFAIKKLCFDEETAVTTLADLTDCLINDWGFDMIEPFQDRHLGPATTAQYAVRYKQLREIALALPKWGSGNDEVNELGDWLIDKLVKLCVDKIHSPALKDRLDEITNAHGGNFKFVITPGIGTFEGYVGDGEPCGASADGRRKGMPIASDLSPTPAAQDLPPNPAFRNIYQAMKSCKSDAVTYGLSNASPVDMNIDEHFPLEDLKKFVKDYALGKVGGNLITLTCADLKTYQEAVKDPEKYNLLRVRMGGWTEFYATMFPAHQEQHQRRQYYTP